MIQAHKVDDLLRRSSVGVSAWTGSVIIAGSRGLVVTVEQIMDGLDRLLDVYGIVCNEVVSGNARGVDRSGEAFARECGLPVKPFPVTPREWRVYGKSAGPRRNEMMAVYASALLAFWDGSSRGTADMVDRMNARRKPALTVHVKDRR